MNDETSVLKRIERMFAFEHLEKPVRAHLKKVYTSLALCMLLAAAGAYLHLATALLQAGLLTLLGSVALLAALAFTPHSRETEGKRFAFLMGFALLTGVGLGPLLDVCIQLDPAIVPTAFMATALVFACFSLSALYAPDKRWLMLGGVLLNALSLMLVLAVANLFLGLVFVQSFLVYAGLLVACGFILYDTQLIMEKKRAGDDDYVWHCVDLFVDMVQLFRRILALLAQKEDRKRK